MGEWLVGRDQQVALLRDLLTKLAAGTGAAILVEGEQGIGKTELLRAGLAGADSLGCRGDLGVQGRPGQRLTGSPPTLEETRCMRGS